MNKHGKKKRRVEGHRRRGKVAGKVRILCFNLRLVPQGSIRERKKGGLA